MKKWHKELEVTNNAMNKVFDVEGELSFTQKMLLELEKYQKQFKKKNSGSDNKAVKEEDIDFAYLENIPSSSLFMKYYNARTALWDICDYTVEDVEDDSLGDSNLASKKEEKLTEKELKEL